MVDRHYMRPMREAVASLNDLVLEWSSLGQIREVDWGRMRSLDFQENLRARDRLAKELPGKSCLLCGEFKDHVSRSRSACPNILLKTAHMCSIRSFTAR